jgi:hypothetical protein
MFKVKIEEAARKVGISSHEIEEIYRAAASEPITLHSLGWLVHLFYLDPEAVWEEYKRGQADAHRAFEALVD